MSLADFVILSKIGEGAYSSVHKVKRISDGLVYALKKVKIVNLNEKQKQNALNEVRLLASFNSDFIIKYKQAFFDGKSSSLCIVMEYADGGDLEKLINKKKKTVSWVDEKQIWTMMRQTLSGINVLHERNIIHRDLKCANIFISGGVFKVADLNVSKLMKKQLAYTQTGTPYYASPEVWQDKPYELKSDIWSFGCILYELCSLKPPFTANSMQGLYRKVMKGVYPKIPAVYSHQLAKIIDLCIKIDPAKRPTAKELLRLIDSKEDPPRTRMSSVNLLNTIRVPKNMQSWKHDLPKADYDTLSQKPADEVINHPKFGHVSQNRLREIVRAKHDEQNMMKKDLIKKINPEYQAIKQIEHAKGVQLDKIHPSEKSVRKSPGEVLPRIKIHSEPNEKPSDRVSQLLAKMKEEDNKKYDYNRPTWWG